MRSGKAMESQRGEDGPFHPVQWEARQGVGPETHIESGVRREIIPAFHLVMEFAVY